MVINIGKMYVNAANVTFVEQISESQVIIHLVSGDSINAIVGQRFTKGDIAHFLMAYREC